MKKSLIVGAGGAGCAIAKKIANDMGDVLFVDVGGAEIGDTIKTMRRLCLPRSRDGRVPTPATVVATLQDATVRPDCVDLLRGYERAVVIAGLGGAVGSGAAPALAALAAEQGLEVAAIVTLPFACESQRRALAEEALLRLEAITDQLIVHDHATASGQPQSLTGYFDQLGQDLRERATVALLGAAA